MIFKEKLILYSLIYLNFHLKYAFEGRKNSIVYNRLRKYIENYKKYTLRKNSIDLKSLKFYQILYLW